MTCDHQCDQGRNCNCSRKDEKKQLSDLEFQIVSAIAVIFSVGCFAVMVRWAI